MRVEEQLADARRLGSALGWRETDFGRSWESDAAGAVVYRETWRGGYWEAYRPGSFYALGRSRSGTSRFRSAASAMRALGVVV